MNSFLHYEIKYVGLTSEVMQMQTVQCKLCKCVHMIHLGGD